MAQQRRGGRRRRKVDYIVRFYHVVSLALAQRTNVRLQMQLRELVLWACCHLLLKTN